MRALQDHDGSHIKGLLINFLDHFFPSLLKIPNFLVEFVTPIVRVSRMGILVKVQFLTHSCRSQRASSASTFSRSLSMNNGWNRHLMRTSGTRSITRSCLPVVLSSSELKKKIYYFRVSVRARTRMLEITSRI